MIVEISKKVLVYDTLVSYSLRFLFFILHNGGLFLSVILDSASKDISVDFSTLLSLGFSNTLLGNKSSKLVYGIVL